MITALRRWLSGEARASDERALDAAVRDDPFVAEAMEGYRAFADADHAAHLEKLRNRLREKSASKKRGGLYLLPRAAAIAASVLLVGAATWWLLQEKSDAKLANVANEQARTEAPAAEPLADVPADTQASDIIAEVPPTTVYKYNSRSKKLKVEPLSPAASESIALADELRREDLEAVAGAARRTMTDDQITSPIATEKPESPPAVAYQPTPKDAAPAAKARAYEERKQDTDAKKMLSESSLKFQNYKGQVTDEQGEPLIGVSVLSEGAKRGTVTDLEGNFNIAVPAEADPQLSFSYTGYESQVANANKPGDTVLNVKMRPSSMALEEVVVSGLSKKRTAPMKQQAIASASPVGGEPAFETYLRNNLRYPAAAREKNLQGTVKLRFTVGKDGSLSNFKILQSLSSDCDKEAIRLIQSGPAWQLVGNAKKAQVVWEVDFSL